MTMPIACTDCSSITHYPRVGQGPDSKTVETIFMEIERENTTQTFGTRRELFNNLNEILDEYSKPDWDGYGADPISEAAFLEARKVISALPVNPMLPVPEIIAEPSGSIAFEWYKGRRQAFIMSVSGKNEIVYSGLFGLNKVHGVEYFSDSVPSVVISALKRLYS